MHETFPRVSLYSQSYLSQVIFTSLPVLEIQVESRKSQPCDASFAHVDTPRGFHTHFRFHFRPPQKPPQNANMVTSVEELTAVHEKNFKRDNVENKDRKGN